MSDTQTPTAERVFLPVTEKRTSRPTSKSVRELARENTERAFNKILDLMESPNDRIALAASVEVLNRGWGYPAMEMQILDDPASQREKATIAARRDVLAALKMDPEHLRKTIAVMQAHGLLGSLGLKPTPTEPAVEIEMIEVPAIIVGDPLTETLPSDEIAAPCACGHALEKDHPSGLGCNLCGCQLYALRQNENG